MTSTTAPRWTFAALAAAISGNLAAAKRREQLDTGSAVELLTAARDLLHQAERLADAASQALEVLVPPRSYDEWVRRRSGLDANRSLYQQHLAEFDGHRDAARGRLVLALSQPGPSPDDESAPDLTRDLADALHDLIVAAERISTDWEHNLTAAANLLRLTVEEAQHTLDHFNLDAGR